MDLRVGVYLAYVAEKAQESQETGETVAMISLFKWKEITARMLIFPSSDPAPALSL
jgi:hypothetical protein